MTVEDMIAALEREAQKDWTHRKDEFHNADIVQGIQIGYDRAIAILRKTS